MRTNLLWFVLVAWLAGVCGYHLEISDSQLWPNQQPTPTPSELEYAFTVERVQDGSARPESLGLFYKMDPAAAGTFPATSDDVPIYYYFRKDDLSVSVYCLVISWSPSRVMRGRPQSRLDSWPCDGSSREASISGS